jgi:four helix bundle protein
MEGAMRDHTKLKVFALADHLALSVYRESASFPSAERFGLQSQMRRAAVSVAANIVEGCARTTQTEYLRFVEIAYASARELQYEIGLSGRLGFISLDASRRLLRESTETAKALNGLLRALQKS